MLVTRDTADRCTGRALGLALVPGLDPVVAVAELVDLVGQDPTSLDVATARFRRCLLDSPDSACVRLALDLCEEAASTMRRRPALT